MNNVKGLDAEDIKIEKGELEPVEEDMFYPKGVLNVLNLVFRNKKCDRPRGKQSPKFSKEEITALADFLFFRLPYVELKRRQRLPSERGMSVKRISFIKHLFGGAKFNGAKAARMAGYSPRCAKQIAHKIRHS